MEQAIEHEVVARGAMLSEDLRAAADRLAELTQEQPSECKPVVWRFRRGGGPA